MKKFSGEVGIKYHQSCLVALVFCTAGFQLQTNRIWGIFKKPFTRSFNFFYWSYIHGVKCKEVDVVFYLRGKCFVSQAKKESYTLECVLEPSVSTYLISVRYAHCTCTAGVAGSCHHLVALLLSVKHCAKKQQDAPEEQTCTTAPQRWEQPMKKKRATLLNKSLHSRSIL